jgi:hypothetical protein
MEMDYLETKGPDSQALTEIKSVQDSSSLQSLSLRRKSIDEKEGIIDLEPIFDRVNLKQASPQKEKEPNNQPEESKKTQRLDGTLSKDVYQSLVD